MHRNAYHGRKDICNLLLNAKGINVNSVDKVNIAIYIHVMFEALFNKAILVYNFYIIIINLFILIVDILLLIFTGTCIAYQKKVKRTEMIIGMYLEYAYRRDLLQIHDAIINNPEGVARVVIDYC